LACVCHKNGGANGLAHSLFMLDDTAPHAVHCLQAVLARNY
jgi:hypothetical protein